MKETFVNFGKLHDFFYDVNLSKLYTNTLILDIFIIKNISLCSNNISEA